MLGCCLFHHIDAPEEIVNALPKLLVCETLPPTRDIVSNVLPWVSSEQPYEIVIHDPYLTTVNRHHDVGDRLTNDELCAWAVDQGLESCTALGLILPFILQLARATPYLERVILATKAYLAEWGDMAGGGPKVLGIYSCRCPESQGNLVWSPGPS